MSAHQDAAPPTGVDLMDALGLGALRLDSFDWARDEISDDLVRAQAAMAQVPPALGDAGLRLRQSARAMEVVGLEAEAHVLRAAARAVADMESGDCERSEYSLSVVAQTLDAMSAALEARAAGKNLLPLVWLPLYRQLCAARNETTRAGDLFYPDLNRRPEAVKTAPPGLPDYLLAQQAEFEHRRFERGLNAWLREPASGSGLLDMRRAVQAIERGQRLPAARAFWWSARALFEAMIAGGLDITPECKQLVQAIERQLRHLLAGAPRVPDELMREVLYHVAIATCSHPHVDAVRAAYALDALLPPAETPLAPEAPLMQAAQPAPAPLQALSEALAGVRAGEAAASPACSAAVSDLREAARELQSLELPQLLAVFAKASDWLEGAATEARGEHLPLVDEMDAALGVLERGFANPGQNEAELQRQIDLLAARLAELEFARLKATPRAPLESLQKERDVQAAVSRAESWHMAEQAFARFESGLQAAMEPGAEPAALESLLPVVAELDEALVRLEVEPAREALAACAQGVRTLIDMGPEAQDAVCPELVANVSRLGEALAERPQEAALPLTPVSAPDIVLAGGFAQPALETGGALPTLREAPPEPAEPPPPAALTEDSFLPRARALIGQAQAGLAAWQAAPQALASAGLIARPVREIKHGAVELKLAEIDERAQGALVMLDASMPARAACEAALGELARAIEAWAESRSPSPLAQPVPQPSLEPAPQSAPAPLGADEVQLSRSIEDATEMAIAAGQMEGEIRLMREGLSELEQRAQSMSTHLQALLEGASPSAETRVQESLAMLTEAAQDLFVLQRTLAQRAGRAESLLVSHISRQRDLQQTLMDLRNLPVDALRQRLESGLARLAQAEGVSARLIFIGKDLALPPTLLDGLAGVLDPILLQMLRSAGPRAAGPLEIDFEIAAQGHILQLALGPLRDTAVLDLVALRSRLAQLPIIGAAEVARVPRAGQGDTLRISLPAPSVAIPALLVGAAGGRAAVPQHLVVHRQMLDGPLLGQVVASGQLAWQGESYPLRSMPELLGLAVPPLRRAQALLLRAGGLRLALLCEPGVVERELVLKKTTSALAQVPGVIGATVIDDDQPLLLLDPITLAECKPRPAQDLDTDPAALRMHPKRVLLVDDSPSARQQARSVLMDAGFDVVLAPGGGQALDCLSDVRFSAALIDSDLGTMDGLELTRRLRADRSLAGLPIIMLSSRRTSAHREAAMMAGVDHYLYKPWQPAELIALLEKALAGAVTPGITQALIRDADGRLEPV